MADFRVEAVLDTATDLYSLEVYYPAEAVTPLARTGPHFQTEKDAYDQFKKKFSEMLPDKEPAKELKPN